ncbi:delta subunit of the central stalk of mitochondrial F1F0 ATP synthase, atp16 [Blyttiomyces sp. JEL0837]|nr:delta subunit of the central stalk of mitochondrial F1F0 ATP synthase, atp16 [Blyttiomyces sp. JEL0837]
MLARRLASICATSAARRINHSSVAVATTRFASPRFYATEASAPAAAPGKLLLNFVVPHQDILKNFEAIQVNVQATEGDMGILSDHVPTIAQLNPGIVDVIASDAKVRKYFVSGGFAVVNADSSLNINAVEAVPLEELDVEAARRGLDEAAKKESASGASDADKAAARIEREVYEAVVYAVSQK